MVFFIFCYLNHIEIRDYGRTIFSAVLRIQGRLKTSLPFNALTLLRYHFLLRINVSN